MGATTNDNDNDPRQECRKCKSAGKSFVCKKSEWLAHAKIHHPLQETPGGQSGERSRIKMPEGQKRFDEKAFFAHIETLPEEVEIFAYLGMVCQIEGDEVISIGQSAK